MMTLLIVFIGGIIASTFAAIGGGVGLLSLPLLMLAGLPPQVAVATSRVGLLGLTISGAYKFAKEGKILWQYVLPLSIISVIGSVIGTQLLVSMDARLLNVVIGILMLATLPLLYLKKEAVGRTTTRGKWLLCLAVYAVIRIYAGLFGGGAATLEFITIERFTDMDLVEANGATRIPSLLAA
ncbi:MAG: sulfite exporter TauE/SafE family protein, partial [bacterium]